MALYVEETGTPGAPAIVFLHAIATSGWMWQPQIDQLGDYQCLAVDLPGHGRSHGERWVSLADTAQQIAEIIRTRATGGRAHIVGLSMGAYVGLQLLGARPEVVDRAVLSGVNVLPFPRPWLMNGMGYLMLPFLKTNAMARMNARGLHIPPIHFDAYRRNLRLMSRTAFLRASRDCMRFRLAPALANVPCPALVVTGEKEHELIRQSLAIIVAAMPKAVGRIVPNVGHGWSAEAPDLFTRVIRAWTSDAPLPPELLPLPERGAAGVSPSPLP